MKLINMYILVYVKVNVNAFQQLVKKVTVSILVVADLFTYRLNFA